jgi:YesN/AraC family two-component response regulator
MEPLQRSTPAFSILVVEDDKSALDMLCLMIRFKLPDSAVYSAEDGRQGVELFKKHTPGIVITDVNMPVMNGMDMAEEIKSIKPDTRFIVLTAYNEKIFFDKFKEIGCSAFILKPVEFKKLFAVIEKCIAEIAQKR